MSTNLSRRTLFKLLGASGMGLALAACGQQNQSSSSAQATTQAAAESPATASEAAAPSVVRVGSLTGPTTIGLVDFMAKAEAGSTTNTYEFTLGKTADEINPLLIKGDLDIALIPANVASVLYNKTQGAISIINVNTLGVLYVVTGDTTIASFNDLAGKTVLMTGKGQTPEYVVAHLLAQAGIASQVTLEFKDTPDEVVAALAADPTATAVLPQPAATAAQAKVQGLSSPISLTDVWNQYESSDLVTGVTVARKEFIKDHLDTLKEFIAGQEASVKAVNADPASAAKLVVEKGIIAAEPIATKAIPLCNLVYETGNKMASMVSNYLGVLYTADASSIGGALPAEDFYWLG